MASNRIAAFMVILVMFLPVGFSRAEQIIVPMDPWPPWKFVDKNTWEVSPDGIDIQLIDTFISSYNKTFGANIRIEYRGYPWKRCLEMMRDGKADLISGIFKRSEREEYMVFIEPPYKIKSSKVFYVRKGEGELIRQYEDLAKLKIGVQTGVKYFERFDNDSKIRKEEASEDLSNFRKLEHGRIDAVISTETQADYLIAVHGFRGKFEKARYKYNYNLPVYFAISKKSVYAEKTSQFSEIVKDLVEEKVFENLIKDYFEKLHNELDMQSGELMDFPY